MLRSWLSQRFMYITEKVDKRFGWHRLPLPLGILTLIGIRAKLRHDNLFDTATEKPRPEEPRPADVMARTPDGSWNDVDDPRMGSVGCRFGRNVPLRHTFPEPEADLMTPSPRLVSRALLTRDEFVPATTLNLLAAAWIQFEVHDWFSHGKNEVRDPWRVPVAEDDPWPEKPMLIGRTRPDPSRTPDEDGMPATYTTDDSHWWDGSQIYGSTPEEVQWVRAHVGGRLRMENGLPPRDLLTTVDLAGPRGNFWVGLAMLHTVFMLEHNAICEALAADYPALTDQQLFDKARLINAALMAKIHTVEWTPAIIAHPTTQLGMRINWWGLTGERLYRRFGRISSSDVISGIPGSPHDHHGVPYSLTEEFVSVYRMHPLIPDDFTFRSASDGHVLADWTLPSLGVLETPQRVDELGMTNLFYSFGRMHPGAITLHNYPRHLQHFVKPEKRPTDGAPAEYATIDLAAIDILRNRERGVPRYNRFRELLHLRPAKSFDDITGNPDWSRQLREVYDGDVDRVDSMVGMFAERLPPGFGFSDTAFRVFVLMASRRLKSDRFFTDDYTVENYTKVGMDWINDNSMSRVILRHYPELAQSIDKDNAFRPWRPVSQAER